MAGSLLQEPQAKGGQLGSTGCNCGAPEGPAFAVVARSLLSARGAVGEGEGSDDEGTLFLSFCNLSSYPRASPMWQQLESEAYVHLIYCFVTISNKG